MNTDPISDMLARIRNAQKAGHAEVNIPASRIKVRIAEILKDEGYVGDVGTRDSGPRKTLTVKLKYDKEHKGIIDGIKRISTPGLRVYRGHGDLEQVRGGLGLAIVSTSKGLMTDRQAREQRLGGEVLCNVW